MGRAIAMMAIALLLIGLGIAETLYANNIITTLVTQSAKIDQLITAADEDTVNTPDITDRIDAVDKFWSANQKIVTFIVNFEKIRLITETIEKLKVAVSEEDYSLSIENARLLKFYSEHLNFVMGSDPSNIL